MSLTPQIVLKPFQWSYQKSNCLARNPLIVKLEAYGVDNNSL